MRFASAGLAVALAGCSVPVHTQSYLYRSDTFALTDTSVIQHPFRAVATSRSTIASNYQRAAIEVNFKFSINGFDNEHPPGSDHMIYLRPRGGRIVTPVYRFGGLEPATTPAPELAAASAEEGAVAVTFRLDMRHVLDSLRVRGSYTPPNGAPIRAGEIKGIYIVGNVAPLSWDFGALVPGSPMQLHDADRDGIYEVMLRLDATFSRPLGADGRVRWTLRRDLSRFPQLESPQRLTDALHNLALEELLDLERDDGSFNAGGRWPGVWTRDLGWSALLGVVLVAPEGVRRGLLTRVDSLGRIIQDSGTGGSWPISTDRVAWALAAWELFAVTGDTTWLGTAYGIITRSAEADLAVVFDAQTGLFRGESSFLDWRDQSYPAWMDPKDIGQAHALGTNVLHYASYVVLGRMARLLGEPAAAARWDTIAVTLHRAVNARFWQPERGSYGQYRYGRLSAVLSPRAEHLGEALSIVFGVADSAQRAAITRSTPVVPFGVPSFWPYLPDIPPYHNAGVWPQVVGFWAWAAAEAGNTAGVEHALANLFRAAALFLTNKENWVATTGHFEGTEVNSDRFMASAAAQLAASYRVLFGIRLEPDRIVFRPVVPRAYAGTRTLHNLRYRAATLTVIVHGFGNAPREVRLDGVVVPHAHVPATLRGAHTVEVTLNGTLAPAAINVARNVASPRTPVLHLDGNLLRWDAVPGATGYRLHRFGWRHSETTTTTNSVVDTADGVVEYQVLAVGADGLESFLSEPVRAGPAAAVRVIEPDAAHLDTTGAGYEGSGYVTLSATSHTTIEIPLTLTAGSWYAIDARYANGSGAVSYGYGTLARALLVDGNHAGTLLMPQRGAQRWDDWGYTNAVLVWLTPGAHRLTIAYTPAHRNMDAGNDRALLDHVRVTRLATHTPPPTSGGGTAPREQTLPAVRR
jgi:hypothetical protein